LFFLSKHHFKTQLHVKNKIYLVISNCRSVVKTPGNLISYLNLVFEWSERWILEEPKA